MNELKINVNGWIYFNTDKTNIMEAMCEFTNNLNKLNFDNINTDNVIFDGVELRNENGEILEGSIK